MEWSGTVRWTEICGEPSADNADRDVFWDYERLLKADVPECFQLTVIPTALFAFLGVTICLSFLFGFILQDAMGGKHKFRSMSLFLVSVLLLLSIFDYVRTANGRTTADRPPYCFYLDSGMRSITFLVLAVTMKVHSHIATTPFWGLQLILHIPQLRSRLAMFQENHELSQDDQLRSTSFLIFYSLVCLSFFLDIISQGKQSQTDTEDETPAKGKEGETKAPECPELKASLWTLLTHTWLLPTFWKAQDGKIKFDDFPNILPEDKVEVLVERFHESWDAMVKDKSKKPSFMRAILYTSWRQMCASVLFKIGAKTFEFLGPIMLGKLLVWIISDDPHLWKGFALAGMLFISSTCEMIMEINFRKFTERANLRTRMTISGAIYRKALKLSNTARRDMSVGEIVNIMSVDSHRIAHLIHMIHDLWSAPLHLFISVFLMWQVVGPSCLAGLGLLILVAPINGGLLSKLYTKYDAKQTACKDLRIKKTSQLLSGIKVLKMYAWEETFADMVNEVRDEELESMQKQRFGGMGLDIFWQVAPTLVTMCILVVYTMSSPENVLTPEKAFLTISMAGSLNWSMSIIPMLIPFYARSFEAIRRIGGMLLKPEVDPEAIEWNSNKNEAMSIKKGKFTWYETEEEGTGPVLKDINIEVERGNLVAVVGAVGSGKSSLLSAMLGELTKLEGSVSVRGSLAYVPQQAWIQNTTLRNNVLFGKEFNQKKYDRVVKACALEHDLKILPSGDETMIGEKGVNLSGGQKQRVSLARALYRGADVYLFDDPLSAVDTHVGKHIFEQVLGPQGLLCKKTRVLVTHGSSFLPHCDTLIVMKDGMTSEVGTYYQLVKNDGAFAEYLRRFANEKHETVKEASTVVLLCPKEDICTDDEIEPKAPIKITRQLSSQLSRQFSRQLSNMSDQSESSDGPIDLEVCSSSPDEEEGKQETEEVLKHLIMYLKSASLRYWIVLFISQIVFVITDVSSITWLSTWSDDPIVNGTQLKTHNRVTVFAILGLMKSLAIFGTSACACVVGINASKAIHRRLLTRIIKAPMSFFDSTPLGRIINRFSTDFEKIDHDLPGALGWMIRVVFHAVSTYITIFYSSPGFIFLLVPFLVMAVLIQRTFLRPLGHVRRTESARSSPIYANFDETLVGTVCVRAFRQEELFTAKCDQLLNEYSRATYFLIAGFKIFDFFKDLLQNVVVFVAISYAILMRDVLTGGLVALLITYTGEATHRVRDLAHIANIISPKLVSLERVNQYSEIEVEEPSEIPEKKPKEEWPENGVIKFEDYSTRYREGLDLVVKNINVTINGGEKVGIVGRTGAGKSSITMGLFRILEPVSGRIFIDDVDIGQIGLHDLRSSIMTIPQDPVLFSGSLKNNLDPFKAYSSEQLWEALELAHLKPFVSGLPDGLDHEVGEGGESLSVGQRQLVCLARALLRRSKILVLDEATAAVDLKTDDLIQKTIRSAFSECTVLTIAHRLNTIMDYDRIMVLDAGEIMEFDKPQTLLADKKSIFHSLGKDAGIVNTEKAI